MQEWKILDLMACKGRSLSEGGEPESEYPPATGVVCFATCVAVLGRLRGLWRLLGFFPSYLRT